MTGKRTAIVLGGSGSVGTALVRELFHDDGFDGVITLSRRSLPESVAMASAAGRRLVEKLVPDMTPESLAAATTDAARQVAGDLEGFSVLGVGAGTAKLTLEEHRAVDVGLNEAFARALRDSGKVRHLAFMSAAGADPTAKASGGGGAGNSDAVGLGARGDQQSNQPLRIEIVNVTKDQNGREVSRTMQTIQRLNDLNMPIRVSL